MTDIFASVREPRPFPFAPLLELSGQPSIARLALRLGLASSTVSTAKALGLTWQQADEWACRLGKHPAEVWPDFWWAECEGEDW